MAAGSVCRRSNWYRAVAAGRGWQSLSPDPVFSNHLLCCWAVCKIAGSVVLLKVQTVSIQLERSQRRDLFLSDPLTVLAIVVTEPGLQPALFERVSQEFPDLVYYDADIQLSLRHAALFNTFPLAHCHFQTDQNGTVSQIQTLDSPWDLDPSPPPLRILCIEPDVDPRHAPPAALQIHYGSYSCRFLLEPARPLLVNLAGNLRQFDPDLIFNRLGRWLAVATFAGSIEKMEYSSPFKSG